MPNLTCSLNPEQIISMCHSETVIWAVGIILLSNLIFMILFGTMIFSSRNTDWKRFAGYIFIVIIATSIIGLFLILSPFTLDKISNFFN